MAPQIFGQKLGIKAGLNLSNVHTTFKDSDIQHISNPGFHVGVAAQLPLISLFSVESGLYATSKGYKLGESLVQTTFSPIYLEIPLKLKATIGFSGLITVRQEVILMWV